MGQFHRFGCSNGVTGCNRDGLTNVPVACGEGEGRCTQRHIICGSIDVHRYLCCRLLTQRHSVAGTLTFLKFEIAVGYHHMICLVIDDLNIHSFHSVVAAAADSDSQLRSYIGARFMVINRLD